MVPKIIFSDTELRILDSNDPRYIYLAQQGHVGNYENGEFF